MTEESAKLRMNLVAIQNVDPYAKEILDSSPHVAYYKFVNNEWQKTEIEGEYWINTFFIKSTIFYFIPNFRLFLRVFTRC